MSGILTIKPDLISPTKLKAIGFVRNRWGSPRTQKEKNTIMYELYDSKNNMLINWFPKKWNGFAYINSVLSTHQLRGRCWIESDPDFANCEEDYVSPVLKTMDELQIFIECVKNKQVEKFKSWENL